MGVARGELPPFWRRWREYLVLGALNVALPFTLIAWAALTLPASLGSILMATVPLFTAPIAAIQLNERVSGRQAAGLIVGFIGVGILVGLRPLPLTPAFAAAVSALLGAAALYALGGVYTARRFTGASPVESTIGQQFAAFVLLLPFALATPPRAWPPPSAVVALLILAVFSSVLAYLLFFRLISSVGSDRDRHRLLPPPAVRDHLGRRGGPGAGRVGDARRHARHLVWSRARDREATDSSTPPARGVTTGIDPAAPIPL